MTVICGTRAQVELIFKNAVPGYSDQIEAAKRLMVLNQRQIKRLNERVKKTDRHLQEIQSLTKYNVELYDLLLKSWNP